MVIAVILLLSILLSLISYVVWKQLLSEFSKKANDFPNPKFVPVSGNVHLFWDSPVNIFKTFRKLACTYYETYLLWSGNIAAINVVTAEDAEIVLSSSKYIEKSFLYGFFNDWLGTGLLTSTGNKWHQRRKMLTQSFHFNILQKFVLTFSEHSQKLVEELKEECSKSKTNIIPIISTSALQIICETSMGTSLDLKNKVHYKYFKSVHEIGQMVVDRVIRPWLYSKFIFDLTPMGWKQKNLVKTLHTFTKSVIKQREEDFIDIDLEDDNGKKKRMAMLDLLISVKRKFGIIDDDGIREEVDTFMFEGHDTTSIAMSFAIMLLANHKEHQDKVYEELKEIFGDSNRAATYEDLQNMKYLDLCLKESLRLYPSVPLVSRLIHEDVILSKHIAPAGSSIVVHIFDLHRNPKYFPDPEKFDPERFLPENSRNRHPFAYIPFSAGPRNCIGQKFAMLEMKSIISAILRNYILESVSTPEESEMKVDLVLRSNQEINVRFKPRT